jgi:hypothetical protein
MPVFPKLKTEIITRLLDAEGTGSTFPQNVCIYWPPQHIIPQDLNLHLHSCQSLKTHTFPKCFNLHYQTCTNYNLNPVALVHERTIPTERPPPVGEVSANFCG